MRQPTRCFIIYSLILSEEFWETWTNNFLCVSYIFFFVDIKCDDMIILLCSVKHFAMVLWEAHKYRKCLQLIFVCMCIIMVFFFCDAQMSWSVNCHDCGRIRFNFIFIAWTSEKNIYKHGNGAQFVQKILSFDSLSFANQEIICKSRPHLMKIL